MDTKCDTNKTEHEYTQGYQIHIDNLSWVSALNI